MSTMLEERLVRREVVFKGRYVQTEVRTVRLPDGKETTREIVSPPNAVAVLPIDASGNVHLGRQYRTALEQVILEIPAGILESGESSEETGRRECEEEAGMIPERMERLCGFYHSVGFSTGRIEIYLATGLTPSRNAHAEEGEYLGRVVLRCDDLCPILLPVSLLHGKTPDPVLWYHQKT